MPSEVSLESALCEFFTFHLRMQTDFLRFVLDGADAQVVDDTKFVWMFTERLGPIEVPVFLSADIDTKTIHVVQSFNDKHASGFPADEIYLEMMVSFLDDIIVLFNEQTEPSKFLYPVLVQSAISFYCSVIAEFLKLPGVVQFMDSKQYGRVAGNLLYWWSESIQQWFCLDTSSKCIKGVGNRLSDPQEGILPDHIALVSAQQDLRNYLAEYLSQYRLFIVCDQIINNSDMWNQMGDSGWVDGHIFYWRLGKSGYLFRIDIYNCVAHQVEQPTDYITFSPELDLDEQHRLSVAIDYVITERKFTEKLLSDIGGNHHQSIPYNTFFRSFSLS